MLEDLSLDNNRIVEIRGLLKLTRLCRLSLVNNELSSVDAEVMACLPNLTFLALDKNFLTLMAGLQHAQSLVELYISNNLIKNIHEIFFLKVRNTFDCKAVSRSSDYFCSKICQCWHLELQYLLWSIVGFR